MHISQISTSACCLGSARTPSASTPRGATGACANPVTCLTPRASTASVSTSASYLHQKGKTYANMPLALQPHPQPFSSPADKAVSIQKALCYRSVSVGTCSLPLPLQITKQICCCSRVGKAWGDNCDRCPLHGSGTFPQNWNAMVTCDLHSFPCPSVCDSLTFYSVGDANALLAHNSGHSTFISSNRRIWIHSSVMAIYWESKHFYFFF